MPKSRSTSKKKTAPAKSPGKIITFYSYKGGTGRSMTLANVAWVLASNGKRVLVIDWDLEAPGLHRFLHPFLDDKTLSSSEGVIDFVVNFAAEALTPQQNPKKKLPKDWYKPHANILRYATSLDWDLFPGKGTLDFVPAGKQSSSYATRVNAFNWQKFYEELGGYWFMEAAKEKIKAEYDYILIDSRTGVSDTSGICTVQLPDILVVCFTLNSQSIEGAGAVAESVNAQRMTESGKPGVRIFPVPTRVEKSEKEKLEMAREVARDKFSPYPWHIDKDKQNAYWGDVEITYEPFYAYEEILATFGDKPDHPTSMLAAMERITAQVSDQKVTRLGAIPEGERLNVISRYIRQRPTPAPAVITSPTSQYVFYFSYARNDSSSHIRKFYDDLSTEVHRKMGRSKESIGFFVQDFPPGEEWPLQLLKALQQSRFLVSMYSPSYFNSEYSGKEVQYFLDRGKLDEANGRFSPQIFPVMWIPPRGPLPQAVNDIQTFVASNPEIYINQGLSYLMRLQRYRDEYLEFIIHFADDLVNAFERSPSQPLFDPPPLNEIRSAWDAPIEPAAVKPARAKAGPSHIKFVYVAATKSEIEANGIRKELQYYGVEGGLDWRPFLPDNPDEIAILAQEVAAKERIRYESIPINDTLIDKLREAERNRDLVIIVIDPWTLRLEPYQAILREFDKYRSLNCAILIVWNGSDNETIAMLPMLQLTLNHSLLSFAVSKVANYMGSIHSAEKFQHDLSNAVVTLRRYIISSTFRVMPREEVIPVFEPTLPNTSKNVK